MKTAITEARRSSVAVPGNELETLRDIGEVGGKNRK